MTTIYDTIRNDKERRAMWERVAGTGPEHMQGPDHRVIIWDLDHPSGPAQIETTGGEHTRNGHGRYVDQLPAGMIPGPHVGPNRIRL
jgi:hypothetical protein